MIGKLMATDVFMNLVLADTEEIRPVKSRAKGIKLYFKLFLLFINFKNRCGRKTV